jgi:hypothetical protein
MLACRVVFNMNSQDERQLVAQVSESIGGWTYEARERAYDALFDGPAAVVTPEERRRLDAIDADLSRRGDAGLWGTDEYELAVTGASNGHLRVVCTHHPEIPYDGFRGSRSLDEATREQFNDLLWDYCELVVGTLQERVDEFVQSANGQASDD